jgi:hypothetical protein
MEKEWCARAGLAASNATIATPQILARTVGEISIASPSLGFTGANRFVSYSDFADRRKARRMR